MFKTLLDNELKISGPMANSLALFFSHNVLNDCVWFGRSIWFCQTFPNSKNFLLHWNVDDLRNALHCPFKDPRFSLDPLCCIFRRSSVLFSNVTAEIWYMLELGGAIPAFEIELRETTFFFWENDHLGPNLHTQNDPMSIAWKFLLTLPVVGCFKDFYIFFTSISFRCLTCVFMEWSFE